MKNKTDFKKTMSLSFANKLLDADPYILGQIKGYLKAWEMYEDGKSMILNEGVFAALYIAPNKLSPYFNITLSILLDCIGTDEDFRQFEESYYKDYEELFNFKKEYKEN